MKDEKKSKISEKNMTDCRFFSIAVDTALFGNEHLLSCFARYSLDSQMIQLPIFFATCFVSSGNDMAQFLFDKLVRRRASLQSCSCFNRRRNEYGRADERNGCDPKKIDQQTLSGPKCAVFRLPLGVVFRPPGQLHHERLSGNEDDQRSPLVCQLVFHKEKAGFV